jgi:hypothetical protein
MYKLLILIAVIFYSCKSEKKNIEYTEKEKGDSILYFKDFDLSLFKGINQLKYDSLNFPFVKLIYDSGKLILKVHYDEKKTHQLTFFKLQNRWCNHTSIYYDGTQEHTFLINIDTGLLKLQYSRNPLDKKFDYPARLNLISLTRVNGDTIIETIYEHFFDNEFSKIPDINKLHFDSYKNICNEIIYSQMFVFNDTIISKYKSIIKNDVSNISRRDWSVNKRKLILNSIFLTDFQKTYNKLKD